MSQAQSATSATNGELKVIKSDMEALKKDFAQLVKDAKATAQSQSELAVERGRDVADDAAKELQAQKVRVEDKVRENPLAAVGVAFGVGVLLAALTRR